MFGLACLTACIVSGNREWADVQSALWQGRSLASRLPAPCLRAWLLTYAHTQLLPLLQAVPLYVTMILLHAGLGLALKLYFFRRVSECMDGGCWLHG